MKTAAVIYDRMNVVTRVEERPTAPRALAAGEFYTRNNPGSWYKLVQGNEEIEMYKGLINA